MDYTEKDFYNLGRFIAARYYKHYIRDFKEMAMDKEDLEQEVNITVHNVLTNDNFQKVTLPLIKKTVQWKLNQTLGNYRLSKKRQGLHEIVEFLPQHETDLDLASINEFTSIPSPERLNLNNLTDSKKLLRSITRLCDVRKFLRPRQSQIVERRFSTNLSFSEIARELKVSRQNVESIYKKAMKKLKYRLLNDTSPKKKKVKSSG